MEQTKDTPPLADAPPPPTAPDTNAPTVAPEPDTPTEPADPGIDGEPEAGENAPAADAASEMAALQDRHLRLQADFDNFRRRVAREQGQGYRRGVSEVVERILPVIDHFELGLRTAEEHQVSPAFLDGLRLVLQQLLDALRAFDLKPIDAEGAPFDPDVHEAVSYIPSSSVPEGVVAVQTRRGYTLGDRLLRPSQVVVSGGPPREITDDSAQES